MHRASIVVVLVACGSSPSIEPDVVVDAAPDPQRDAPIAVACADKTVQPVDATWMLGTRSANVHVPASYDPDVRTPVVLNIHGRTSDASQQASLSHAIALSDAEGFILVHPRSATSPTSWNAGSCCSPATTDDVDDVLYLSALLDMLEDKLCVDPGRVFAMGMSNGGYLSHTIADGGHQWPGGETIPFLGKKSDNLIATDAIWNFFKAHPRP